jgi:Ser/Thr protein kinase RdoA (MazF antagonist)
MNIDLYRQQFHLENATLIPIEHPDAMVAQVFHVLQPGKKPCILKICARLADYLNEAYFLDFFSSKLPIPKIIATIAPDTNQNGAILMEYISGKLLSNGCLNNELACALGKLLACIHINKVNGFGDLTQPASLSNNAKVYFSYKFDEAVVECEVHFPNELLDNVNQYFHSYLDLLTSVDGPCITHRDFRPGNIIIDNNKVQAIIDWSSARASFAEEDFCPFEFEEWTANTEYKQAFLKGYASIRPLPNYLRLLPLLRLSRAMSVLGFIIKTNTWSSKHAKLYNSNMEYLKILFS